ncbi:hypothetical protein ACQP3L_39850, partial [Escherichia coli]
IKIGLVEALPLDSGYLETSVTSVYSVIYAVFQSCLASFLLVPLFIFLLQVYPHGFFLSAPLQIT